MIIGLTGSFGTGKTFTAAIFKSLGANVIDADVIAHDAIMKGAPAYGKIVAAFGRGVLRPDRQIDRRRLAEIVFGSVSALAKLNKIVHPEVIRVIRTRIKMAGRDAVVVIDAPLLIESRLVDIVDKLVVVKCSKKRQIARCVKKFRMTPIEALKRIESQMSMKKKLKMADFVVRNDGTRSRAKQSVLKIWGEIAWR